MHTFSRALLRSYALIALFPFALVASEETQSSCGNKHKNLVILQNILSGIPGVTVPAFFGIESARISQFIAKNTTEDGQFTQYDPFPLYESVITRLNAVGLDGVKDSSIANDLQEVAQRIRFIFDHAWDGKYPFEFTPAEKQFLKRLQGQGHYLMVRSTGVEDSVAFANAGANVSKAYITPEAEEAIELQKAMGQVVASYVTLHSLKNRLAQGHTLEASIFMPVLIQELVGEPINSQETDPLKIPVSGVAYSTNQQLSDTALKVTEINASYGHGEGIVANRVTADKYYLVPSTHSSSAFFVPQIYTKHDRLVPQTINGAIELETIENPSDLAQKPCLSPVQLNALYNALMAVEKAYQIPMDVEFVVKSDNIYIVQARPTMYKADQATFIDVTKISPTNNPIIHKESLRCLVPSKSSVLVITDPQDLLITHNLDEADQDPRSVSAHVVIVDTWASSLSHAAVNFMGHGIPCFYVHNIRAIELLANKITEQNPLIIDVQQSLLIHWDTSKSSFKDVITTGWFEHPVQARFSVSTAHVNTTKQVLPSSGLINSYCSQLAQEHISLAERKELCNKLNAIVQNYLQISERRIKNVWNNHFDTTAQQALSDYKFAYATLMNEINAVLAHGNPSHFQWLFYIKLLQALLYQNPAEHEQFIGGYTYQSFLDVLYFKQLIAAASQKLGYRPLLAQEILYAQSAPTQEIALAWRTFILGLEKEYTRLIAIDPSMRTQDHQEVLNRIDEFKSTLGTYAGMNCLPLWLSSEFYPALSLIGSQKPTDILLQLLQKS
ncbi:hypothetical protein Noda2021_03850 [Candidatus Dependentiae bacterium Noda2021]|nr:hypothetical protein Noda2021_03850 [Candidatus Dependentiae bacterium Noda2021]